MTTGSILFLTCAVFSCLIPQAQNFNCGNCQAWNSNRCCAFFGTCCTTTAQRQAVATTGFCPNPIPNIPPQGISAVLCTNDVQCNVGLRCCPIRQASTGQYFQICTVPAVLPVAPLTSTTTIPTTTRSKPGSCPNSTRDIPPEGITAIVCTQDSDCHENGICCPIRQTSTGNIFLICTAPIIITTTLATTTTRPTTTPPTTTPPTTTPPTTTPPTTPPPPTTARPTTAAPAPTTAAPAPTTAAPAPTTARTNATG